MRKRFMLLIMVIGLVSSVYAGCLKILFIGDSITDGNWGNSGGSAKPSSERTLWDMNHIYGSGYMYLCAAYYQGNYPEREYEFYNRGISGNTLNDLEKRWTVDVIELQPDVLSILIGTNDVDEFLKSDTNQTFDFIEWEKRYRSLLDNSLQSNPNLKIVLCLPFVAYTGKMHKSMDFEKRDMLVNYCAGIVKQIAKDYKAICLPFNLLFDKILKETPTSQDTYWIWDGIHPTPAGHQRMAAMWIKAVKKRKYLK